MTITVQPLRVVPDSPELSDFEAMEAAFAADRWDARDLGVSAPRGREVTTFAAIVQPWLRDATKQWCRWRLATGSAYGTISASALAMSRLSAYLAARCPTAGPVVIDRRLIEGYISWLTGTHLAANSRALALICLRAFLDHNRRHGWLPDVAADSAIYQDDLPKRTKALPRFVSEFVMDQLQNEANLDLLEPTTRHLVIVLMETGLRVGDAVVLPFDPVVDDSVGWPCLRYIAAKTRVEQLLPLSVPAATAIEAQQADVARRFPDGSPWLFPDPGADGTLSYPYRLLLSRLKKWETKIGLHDERGRSLQVTSHQFRHTLGTRLINAGVPQHVVQRVLGHASPEMTGVYAQLHDHTIREAFERYQSTRVDITGEVLEFDPAAPTATAEWIKHHLNKIQAALPNGYCGRPPQQDCPHPNACLTCPDFQTTVEFIDIHRRHADSTTVLIAAAEAKGNQRLADNHRRVHANLTRIIDTLDTVAADDPR
jgi:site-specific recombinase XerD